MFSLLHNFTVAGMLFFQPKYLIYQLFLATTKYHMLLQSELRRIKLWLPYLNLRKRTNLLARWLLIQSITNRALLLLVWDLRLHKIIINHASKHGLLQLICNRSCNCSLDLLSFWRRLSVINVFLFFYISAATDRRNSVVFLELKKVSISLFFYLRFQKIMVPSIRELQHWTVDAKATPSKYT